MDPNIIGGKINTILNQIAQSVDHLGAAQNDWMGAQITRGGPMFKINFLATIKVGFGGFFDHGGYGRGALLVNNVTVDYYSVVKGSGGLQIGVQQFAHVLFFMTEDALAGFRQSAGWAAGADLEYVVSDSGNSVAADSTTVLSPVLAAVFARAGLRFGATLEGSKYTRIIP